MYSYNPYYEKYLAHHGVLGMHWGIRRYQPYTHGQKGIFKGLRKQRRAEIKSLRRDLRGAKNAGDSGAIDIIRNKIKETKKTYANAKDAYKKQFREENFETYKDKVAREGTLEEVSALRSKLSPEQLNYATSRLTADSNFEDFAKNNNPSIKKLQRLSNKLNAIAGVGSAGINVIDQVNTLRNMFGDDSKVSKLSKEATAGAALDRLKKMTENPVTDILPKDLASKKQLKALKEYQDKKFEADNAEKIGKGKHEEEIVRTQKEKTEQEYWKAEQEKYKAKNPESKSSSKNDKKSDDVSIRDDSVDVSYSPEAKSSESPKSEPASPKKKTSLHLPDVLINSDTLNKPVEKVTKYDPSFRSQLDNRSGDSVERMKAVYDESINKKGNTPAEAQRNAMNVAIQNAKATNGGMPISVVRKGKQAQADYIINNIEKYEKAYPDLSEWARKYKSGK